MDISTILMRTMAGFAIISFPSYLKVMIEMMSNGPRSGPSQFFNYMQNAMIQLSQMESLPYICYILGGINIFWGFLNLMRVSEAHTTSFIKYSDNNTNTSLTKEVSNAVFSKNKEEINYYDFQNEHLNKLVIKIQEKLKYLKGHELIRKDMEVTLLIENIQSEYLSKIFKTYIQIPENKREEKKEINSPFSLTANQLNIILSGLEEVENRIVNNNIMNQKAHEIFLKEKMGSI